MPAPVANIYPGSTTYTHEVALALPSGQKYGLRLKDGVASIRDNAPQSQAAADQIQQFSYHLGRGQESFTNKNNHYGYWDAKDAWLMTAGKAHPTLLWQFAKGLRSQDIAWFGSITWKKITTSGDPYLSVSFASSGFTGTHMQFPIRRRGNPGTLTVALKNDSSGSPGATTHQSVTVTKSNVTDTVMVIYDGDPSSFALVASTTYHLVFSCADTDDNNCWEIGCNAGASGKRSANGSSWTTTTYAPYYRLTNADTSRTIFMFMYDNAMYAVDRLGSGGNSTLWINGGRGKATSGTSTTLTDSALGMTVNRYVGAYIQIIRGTGEGQVRQITANTATAFTVATWASTPSTDSEYVVYGTPWFHAVGATGIDGFTSAAVGATGLVCVVSKPANANNIVYFPQGDGVGIRRMQWNPSTKVHDFGTETATGNQGTATFLEAGYDAADGPQIWRGNRTAATGSGGADTVSRANATTWGVALVFRLPNGAGTKGIYIGDTSSLITGMEVHEGTLFVHKENGLFTVSNDRATERKYGAEDMPSKSNGAVMASSGSFLYISFWTTLMQLAGGSVNDTKLWLSNLPAARTGYVQDIEAALGWVFLALSAPGTTGISSVLTWINEAQAFHEVLRGFEAARGIRSVFWQPNEEVNPYLWAEIGGELVYQVFPRVPRPLTDTSVQYMPEGVLETSTIDLNVNPKFFGKLSVVTKNLSQSGMNIFVDYQMDNYIGSTTWFNAGAIVESPLDSVDIGVGRARKLRLRFRMNTSSSTTPPILEQWGLEYFERTPSARFYQMECSVAPSQQVAHGGGIDHKPTELFKALDEIAKGSQVISADSIFGNLHGKTLTMYLQPKAEVEAVDRNKEWTGNITVYLKEVLQ